jgi:RNA recognition motif-containing protein
MPRTELFVGNLAKDISKQEIEDLFEKYGKVVRCDVKDRGKLFQIALS